MMRSTGPRGLGEQGLLDAPPIAHKNKPKFFMYNTHTPHNIHTHNCGCTQSNINADTNATGDEVTNVSREERDQNNTDTTDGITAVRDFRDILPFHDRFLQRLSARHRWVLYRVSFSQSPDQQFDTACDRTWTKEYGLHEIERLDKAVYMLLQETFQDFAPAHPIFGRHRVEHPLCASRVWFSLRDRFKLQLVIATEQPITTALRQQLTELTKTSNGISQPPTSTTTSQWISTKTAPHMYNTHTPPRVSYTRHTAHNNTHKTRPHHHYGGKPHTNASSPYINAHITTTTDIRHRGVNISPLKFKKRIEQFTDRPSDRVGSTNKIIVGSPLLRGGGKSKEGHTKNNTIRVSRKKHTRLGRPSKRASETKDPLTEEEPEFPGPIIIDDRIRKKERLAPIHFIKCSRNPAHIKRKLSWWDFAIDSHSSKTRLSRRWTYILNRRQHRQLSEPQQPCHRHTQQVYTTRNEYLGTRVDYSWEGIHGYTTPLPTLTPDIIDGQLNNNRFTIIA